MISIKSVLDFLKPVKLRFSKIYVKFFLAMALLVFIAILVVGFVFYSISKSALTEQISYEKVNTLTQTRNTADITLKDIEKSFVAESIDPQLLKFTSVQFGDDYELLKEIVKSLVSIKNADKYIFSVYIYMPKQNIIVTTEDGFWKASDFYDLAWMDFINSNAEGGSWTTTRNIKTFSNARLGVVSYITSIPFDEYPDTNKNLLVVNVYEKELLKLIQGVGPSVPGLACIADGEGKVISHEDKSLLGNALKFDRTVIAKLLNEKSGSFTFDTSEGRFLASHVRSSYNKWNYISIVPEKQITSPILELRVMILVVALICILLGFIVARIVSFRIYRPISETVITAKEYVNGIDALVEDKESKNEMDFLNKAIMKIVDRNKNLSSTMQKNEVVLKESFIRDILLSSTIDEVKLENRLTHFNISFSNPNFYILVILVDKYSSLVQDYNEKDISLYFFGIKNIAEEMINTESYGIMVRTDKDRFAAVLNNSQTSDEVYALAERIIKNVNEIFKITLTIGISSCFSTPNEIGYMYNEALGYAAARIMLGGGRAIDRRDIGRNANDTLMISSTKEEQIFNNIRLGNTVEALKNIEKVVNMIRKEASYSKEEIYQFFYSVLYTSIRAVNDNGWSVGDIFGDNCNLYRDLAENDTLEDIFNWTSGILSRMSHFILEKKESKNYSLIESILNYMNTNYNKDISLNSMADYVSLSTPYLSKLFKSETGENFLEYLTKIRIEKSKELLKEPDYKITTISEKVNFGNAQNYIRIFKKYEGMTPGQYREAYIKENLNRKQGDE